jgi:hypothetical protein
MSVKNVSWCKFALVIVLAGSAAGACSSSGSGGIDAAGVGGSGASTGSGGTTGSAGATGRGGTTGSAGRGGTTGSGGRGGTTGSGGSGNGGTAAGAGGATGSAGATGTAGTMGTQPIGAACANTANCSQADGAAVCCLQISTCVLATQCPGSTNYVPCTDDASCNKGGWICCKTSVMNYCTKSNGCVAP